MPSGDMLCTPDCVQEVVIKAPVGVDDRLNGDVVPRT